MKCTNTTHRRGGLFLFLLSPCYKSGRFFTALLITVTALRCDFLQLKKMKKKKK